MLNIVIPMAGAGSRFADAGYQDPKPLIPVHGVPMIRLVIENIRPLTPHRFIFICRKAHLDSFGLESKLIAWSGPDTVVTSVEQLTEGAACTVLTVEDYIDNNDQLMIANCDQYIDVSIDSYLRDLDVRGLDGLIMTLKSQDPKWSYASVDAACHVSEVVEKKVISEHATVGIYNFRSGSDFVRGAKQMIANNLRVNNEFYVAPVYNQLISEGLKYGIYGIGGENEGMYGLGIPSDLELFLKHPVSQTIKSVVLR